MMARIKQPPRYAPPRETGAHLPSDAFRTKWLSSSSNPNPIKCEVCDTLFTDMSPSAMRDHIDACLQPDISSGAQPQLQLGEVASNTDDINDGLDATSAFVPETEGTSSRLTTPPESPIVGPASGEGSLTNLAGLDDGGAEDVGQLAEEDEEELAVKPYTDNELEYYDFEDVERKEDFEETPEALSLPGSGSDVPTLKVKRYGFPKLTSLENFEQYLANSEEMSYDTLYHRTSTVNNVMVEWQNEYKKIDQQLKDFEKGKASRKEREKEDQERALAEKDIEMWRLYNLYYTDVQNLMESQKKKLEKKPAKRDWKSQAADLLRKHPQESEDAAENIAQLFTGNTMAEMRKRRDGVKEPEKPAVAEAKNKLDLIDVPDPKLSAADRAIYSRKRKPEFEDPAVFELRKQSDVYGLPLKGGKIELVDRNAVDETQAVEDENGRPKRNRNKPTTYDTEQSEEPGESSEELPAKRRRTQTYQADVNGSPSRPRVDTREGSLAPRTFASGKRIGRPPGSKTKAKPAKSKLQQSHLPPASEGAESESEAEPEASQENMGESHAQELQPEEEAQLQEAAEALVTQTAPEQDVPVAPKKGKHGGARKKGTKVKPEPHPVKPAQGGHAKKQADSEPGPSKSRKGGRPKKDSDQTFIQNAEENEVIQSTEHNDESRFASASTSRPTTATSEASATTLGSHHATREEFKVQGEEAVNGEVSQSRAAAKGKAKRKRAESQQNGVADATETVAPVRKKRRTVNNASRIKDAPEANGEAATSGRQKHKRAPTFTQDSIQVALPDEAQEVDESTPPAPKRRKGGKFAATQPSTSDPLDIYESTPPPAKRGGRRKPAAKATASSHDEGASQPKRRNGGRATTSQAQASTSQDDPLGIYESTPPSPKSRGRNAKGKGVKQEATESEYVSGDAEEAGRKTRKSRPVTRGKNTKHEDLEITESSEPAPKKKATRRKAKMEVVAEAEAGIDDVEAEAEAEAALGDDEDQEETKAAPKKRRPAPKAKAKAVNKGKGKAIEEAAPALAPATEATETAEGEMDEAELKAKQKSAKLSAATRARWASGKMVGPMQKRRATNEAKKAARLAAKAAQDGNAIQPAAIAGPSTAAAPAQQPIAPVLAPAPAPNPGSGESSGTRTSGRKRKPTSRALGFDGADDDDDDDAGQPFRSIYDHFQALSSPGTPALGKRQRKSLMDLSAAIGSEDDSEEFF